MNRKNILIIIGVIVVVAIIIAAAVFIFPKSNSGLVIVPAGTYHTHYGKISGQIAGALSIATPFTSTASQSVFASFYEINVTLNSSAQGKFFMLNWTAQNNTEVIFFPIVSGQLPVATGTVNATTGNMTYTYVWRNETTYAYSTNGYIHLSTQFISGNDMNSWQIYFIEETPASAASVVSNGVQSGIPPETITFTTPLVIGN